MVTDSISYIHQNNCLDTFCLATASGFCLDDDDVGCREKMFKRVKFKLQILDIFKINFTIKATEGLHMIPSL